MLTSIGMGLLYSFDIVNAFSATIARPNIYNQNLVLKLISISQLADF